MILCYDIRHHKKTNLVIIIYKPIIPPGSFLHYCIFKDYYAFAIVYIKGHNGSIIFTLMLGEFKLIIILAADNKRNN